MNVWVTAAVRFAAVAPDDWDAAEDWADNLSDAIVAKIEGLDYSIEDGSVSVVDWTQEEA